MVLLIAFHAINAQDAQFEADFVCLQKAHHLFESGHHDSAITYYEKYLSSFNQQQKPGYIIPEKIFKNNAKQYLGILLRLGTSYNLISAPDNALNVLNSGLMIAGTDFQGYSIMKPWYIYQIGNAWLLKMDYKYAIKSYQNALAITSNDIILVQKINQNLGGIFFFLEDYDKAIEHYQKALLSNTYGLYEDPVKVSELLINTGAAFAKKNDVHNAMEYYSRAEKLLMELNITDRDYARLYLNLGNLLLKMNNPDAAYDHFMKASDLYHRNMPVKSDEMILIYTNIARFYKTRMLFDSTIHYLNLAVSCINKSSDKNPMVITNLYQQIGDIYGSQGHWKQSLEYYQKAFNMIEAVVSDSMKVTGFRMSNSAEILELFRIRQAIARALHMLGLMERSDDYILQSFHESLSVINLVKTINEEFGREGSKLLFNESVKNLYYNALESGYYLGKHGHPELLDQLFLIAEKSRNKILLSGIMDNIARRSSGIPDSLILKEQTLNDEISFCLRKLWLDPEENEEGIHDRYVYYLNRLIESHKEIDSLESKYKSSSPVYRKIKEQETVKEYGQLKRKLLPEEALLEYFIGDTSMFIFLLRPDSLIIKRITISSDFNDEILKFNKEIRIAEVKGLYESGYHLYSQLILPVRSSLVNVNKLIIIPDENLSTIPFEALVTESAKFQSKSFTDPHSFLINDFEICYHFSSTLWFNSATGKEFILKTIDYAGFAPVTFLSEKIGNLDTDNKSTFSSLPFSRNEIHDVSDLIRRNGEIAHVFIGHDATPERFRENLADQNIIHVATHSLISDEQPGLSGLVLAPDNHKGQKGSIYDGMIFLDEIFNLRINADLLVLSACATGSGKITRSEGVLAMTRGFFTAGASNIVYTLWNVTDKHTRDFMVTYFKGILAGQSFSAALRNAKIEMISKPETSLPRLWAPYVLLGK